MYYYDISNENTAKNEFESGKVWVKVQGVAGFGWCQCSKRIKNSNFAFGVNIKVNYMFCYKHIVNNIDINAYIHMYKTRGFYCFYVFLKY